MKKTLLITTFAFTFAGVQSAHASFKDHCRRAAYKAAKKDVHAQTDDQITDVIVTDVNNLHEDSPQFEVMISTETGLDYSDLYYYVVTTERHVQGRSCKVTSIVPVDPKSK